MKDDSSITSSKARPGASSSPEPSTRNSGDAPPTAEETPATTDVEASSESSSEPSTLENFTRDVTQAAQNILKNDGRKIYQRVVVFISYWELPDGHALAHIKKYASKLAQLFKKDYQFTVEVYPIQSNVNPWAFTARVGSILDPLYHNTESLFIMYYGGHAKIATQNPSQEDAIWLREERPDAPKIDWSSSMLQLFEGSQCDKLFIFDCCYAGDMIDTRRKWSGVCELLGAWCLCTICESFGLGKRVLHESRIQIVKERKVQCPRIACLSYR